MFEKKHRNPKILAHYTSRLRRLFSTSPIFHRKNKFGTWLQRVWFDALTMFLLVAIAFALRASNTPIFMERSRRFPMHYSREDLWYGPASISRPREPLRLSNLTAGISFTAAPLIVILIMQVFIRSFSDMNAAIFGLLKGLATMTLIQVVLKLFLGALRPYFLEVCRPPSNVLDNARNAFRSKPDHALTNLIWASTSMCTGDPKDIRNAMESYPSGHTATAFTVGFFLALYLNSKTKAFADYQTGYWKMFIVIVPILGACLASSLVVIDGNHHARDVILSIPIGILVAILAYRAQYTSVFRYQNNHIPLSYDKPALPKNVDEKDDAEKGRFLAVKWPGKTHLAQEENAGAKGTGEEV